MIHNSIRGRSDVQVTQNPCFIFSFISGYDGQTINLENITFYFLKKILKL